ncbi:hypothetical protein M5K25_009353 [Dendrobium thyrsiflorum]|uniref:Uncharacterized protein n=1 Tax=Dendrobium thyrsiflorum TaxID=117978 RepID=A0ABD0VCB0_DENTH
MANNLPLSGDLVLVDGRRQGEEDPVDVVVDIQVEIEEWKPENIHSSLKIIHESMIMFRIGHSWIGRPGELVAFFLEGEQA